MKTTMLLLIPLFMWSCNNSNQNKVADNDDQSKVKEAVMDENKNQDYQALYAMSETCKLTREELATLFGFTTAQMETQLEQNHSCGFNLIYKDGNEGWFNVKVVDFPKRDIADEIQKLQKDELYSKNLVKTEKGENYIYQQPARPILHLMNPNYDNKVLITYRALLAPDLSKTQKSMLKEKGLQTANFLIAKFENYDQ